MALVTGLSLWSFRALVLAAGVMYYSERLDIAL